MREKLIELIRNTYVSVPPLTYRAVVDDTAAAVIADHLSNSGMVAQQWIPVTERLPENEGVVLVCGSRGGIYTAEFRRFVDFGRERQYWHKLNSKSHHCEPTHWMPLPEPPEEA